MLLWIKTQNEVKRYSLQNAQEHISLENLTITVILQKHQIFIRVTRDYFIQKNILKNEESTTILKNQTEICKLLFLDQEENHCYKKYQCLDSMTIGSSKDNDICIDTKTIPFHLLKIDFIHTLLFLQTSYDFCSINDNTLHSGSPYQILSVIKIDSIRIILLEDGIMINTPKNVFVHLREYVSFKKIQTFEKQQIRRIKNRIPSFSTTFIFTQTCPKQNDIHIQQRPLYLEIGPSIMMASASLLTGFLSAYQSYEDGREFLSILPMILLPFMMLGSTLLFQPLTRRYERKRNQKIKQENQIQKEAWIQSFQDSFLNFKREYLKYINQYYPSMNELNKQIQTHENIYMHPLNHVNLRFFETTDVFTIQAEDVLLKHVEDSFLPKLFDVRQYHHIVLQQHPSAYQWIQYIILQLVCFYDVPVMIVASEDWFSKNMWCRNVFLTHHLNQRMLVKNREDFYRYHDRCKDAIVIVMEEIIQIQRDCILFELKKDIYESDADIVINFEGNTYFDRYTLQEKEFQFEGIKVVMGHLLYLLWYEKYELHSNLYDFYSIHQIQNITDISIEENWKKNHVDESLHAIIGIDENNQPILLDLNERKDGPHGLIAGMTGSGKSELIISMLLSIALQYSYEEVQFALIDFKGGGAANVLKTLPHICGILSNLDVVNMQRALVSFQNVCRHRQEMIAKMNDLSIQNVSDLKTYRQQRVFHPELENIPDLLIVIDEFAELKRLQPDFLTDLISIARVGRSLGIHLILCTQKPAGIINDEIWSNCSFQIVLKVADKKDLEEVIRVKTEESLSAPGEFLLQSHGMLKKGRSAYTNTYSKRSTFESIDLYGNVQWNNIKDLSKQQIEILSLFQRVQIPQLWLQPLENLYWNSNIPKHVIGRIDDFYHRQYLDLYLYTKEKRNTVFLCQDLQRKKQCLYTIFHSFITHFDQEELFVIDDVGIFHQEHYECCANWVVLCTSQYEEKVQNTFRYIKNSQRKEKIVCITDLSRFFEANEMNRYVLRDLLEHASYYHVCILLFVSSTETLSYREYAFIHNRYAYYINHGTQIQQFLETNEKEIPKDCGILKLEHLLSFQLYEVEEKQLFDTLRKNAQSNKLVTIPSMPRVIDRRNYHGYWIPLGICYDNYEWIALEPNQSIYVVSMYPEEWVSYLKQMRKYAKCTTRDCEDEEDGQLIFLSLEEYRKYHQSYPVLYIGTSFQQQYLFHSMKKIKDTSQAIFMKDYESQLLKVL